MNQTWSKADLHIHTTHSDGAASVEEVLEYVATRTDLRVIAITDHDTIEGALEARRLAPSYGLEVIVGEEISTREGHLLALFLERFVAPRQPAAATIAQVHAQGGLCIAAHPYDWVVPSLGRFDLRRRCAGDAPEWPLDAIEGFNASLWLPSNNRRAGATAGALGMASIGGSDSHHLPTIGSGHTLFPGTTAQDVYEAIRAGTTVAAGRHWLVDQQIVVVGRFFKRVARQVAGRALRPLAAR
ncbi:MAG TPA: PHP domain-containing protein [Roseiflexaceae bacterium]|nr:PHP domain-containing protein [Roseiflexaceae bacterium]